MANPGCRRVLALLPVVWILCAASSLCYDRFDRGPVVLDGAAVPAAAARVFVPLARLANGQWLTGAAGEVRALLDRDGGLLLVGYADPVGPRALNQSLGLQYALAAARQVGAGVGVAARRLACASAGERSDGPPGVAVWGWAPEEADALPPRPVSLLEPAAGVPADGRAWGVWEAPVGNVLLGWDTGAGAVLWEVAPHGNPLEVAFPSRARQVALGVELADGAVELGAAAPAAAATDAVLTVTLYAAESGSARLVARRPPGYREPLLWAGGIPYRVPRGAAGEAEVQVALLPRASEAYLEAYDRWGERVVGPPLPLPAAQEPVGLLAVLTWFGDGVDLDLHAWRGAGHTYPGNPDPAFSPTAVPGTRLLFDGAMEEGASALLAAEPEGLSLDVECFADLEGAGATAWLYVLEYPADPLQARGRLLGPRRLSAQPRQARWPALRLPTE